MDWTSYVNYIIILYINSESTWIRRYNILWRGEIGLHPNGNKAILRFWDSAVGLCPMTIYSLDSRGRHCFLSIVNLKAAITETSMYSLDHSAHLTKIQLDPMDLDWPWLASGVKLYLVISMITGLTTPSDALANQSYNFSHIISLQFYYKALKLRNIWSSGSYRLKSLEDFY